MSGNLFTDISDHFANVIILDSKTRKERKNQRPNVRIFSEKTRKIFLKAKDKMIGNVIKETKVQMM